MKRFIIAYGIGDGNGETHYFACAATDWQDAEKQFESSVDMAETITLYEEVRFD